MTHALTTEQVRDRLDAMDVPEVLVLLGFTNADARDTLALVEHTRADPTALARIS